MASQPVHVHTFWVRGHSQAILIELNGTSIVISAELLMHTGLCQKNKNATKTSMATTLYNIAVWEEVKKAGLWRPEKTCTLI